MVISRAHAFGCGLLAIGAVVALAAFNSFTCYRHDFETFVAANSVFVAPPLVPAVICLAFPNPLRAVGACLFVAPWLLFAYYTDCMAPTAGGGASMVYVSVLLWGIPSAIVGALLAGPVARWLNIHVAR
ncbi:Na+:solute symporter [Stutzerimonas azotifigens]|uniref:Na+:solute symporter n=1 Tax=Stutzerimonas azotifigens TaxID=291995 RepID=A0ABR5YYK1_9GAMM|nr:Na+:solute symporter [Stutzerimonas azotifigens]MBA1272966.1 Na+:solute symporter [Stutzerimonas azotifigens]